MVYPYRRRPGCSYVATVTGIGAENMGTGLGCCSYQRAGFVTPCAQPRRAFEYTAIVAAFTVDSHVRAGEGKSCGEMVEVGARRGAHLGTERNR